MTKKKQAKKAASKKEGGALGWIIAAIVVIVILFLVVKCATKEEVTTETTAPETTATEKGGLYSTTAPEINAKCVVAGSPTGPTIGVVPGTQVLKDGVLSVTFKNNGKIDISSTVFEFADLTGKVVTGDVMGKAIYRQNNDAIAPGETITYNVDLDQVSQELGAKLYAFSIYPTMDGKACLNGKQFVIKYEG
ncbi:hypothetical protein JXB27_00105 [Candidatus Woesearchaeota archaeon]|nr:hypothetical protein [Candidatus Woesearchaeota archaeon]